DNQRLPTCSTIQDPAKDQEKSTTTESSGGFLLEFSARPSVTDPLQTKTKKSLTARYISRGRLEKNVTSSQLSNELSTGCCGRKYHAIHRKGHSTALILITTRTQLDSVQPKEDFAFFF
ncbi:unnamed protein product, partial [Amoebophrya sp. A120]